MSKFKVGDKVRIKKGLVGSTNYSELFCNPEMTKLCGSEITIREFQEEHKDRFYVTENRWTWCDEMVEEIISPTELIKDKMETGLENVDKDILTIANIEVLREIADEEKQKAKKILKDLYAKKKQLESAIDGNQAQLDEVLKGLSKVKKK